MADNGEEAEDRAAVYSGRCNVKFYCDYSNSRSGESLCSLYIALCSKPVIGSNRTGDSRVASTSRLPIPYHAVEHLVPRARGEIQHLWRRHLCLSNIVVK